MKIKALVILLVLFFSQLAFAQKEADIWYFGCTFRGASFNSGTPVILKNKRAETRYGCATISTSAGRLLFYVTESLIIDSTQNLMPNGALKNDYHNMQPNIIVPWPDSAHLFYVFSSDPFSYSVVNMKLRGGLGDVVSDEKEKSLPAVSCGKMSVVKHANQRDYWVVMPQGNTDTIKSYLITSKGISITPVRSATGVYCKAVPIFFGDDYSGYFKLSPDGKKVCNINLRNTSMLADFDNASGKVSNVWKFTSYYNCLEFSAKSNYLYFCSSSNVLSQYNLSSKTQSEFLASRKTIDSSKNYNYQFTSMQLAPDEKIYIYEWYGNKYLNVIHAPDSAYYKTRFEKNFFKYQDSDETSVHRSLPNFVQSIFHKPSFGVKQNCANDSVFFSIKETYELDSVHWDFGDPSSGTLNTSRQTQNVFHHYKLLGNYKVRLISFHKTYTDTIYETFLLKPLKPNLGRDSNLCYSKYLLLSPGLDYAGYKWSVAPTTKTIYVTTPGTYYLTVTDYAGCKGSDTIKIFKPIVKADFIINDSSQCLGTNDFLLNEKTSYTNGKRQKSAWMLNDSIISSDTAIQLKFKDIGSYPVKLLSISEGGCRDSITKILSVHPGSKVNFSINDSIQCFNNQSFDFKLSKDTGNIIYQWNLGDESITIPDDIIGKRYLKDSTYKVVLTATTDNGCADTITKTVTILPSPTADFTWDNVCRRTPTKFQYTGSKPITSYQWNFNNESTSTLENPSHQFASAGNTTSTLTITSPNGCSAITIATIEILPQSKADFTANDVCETDSAEFINQSLDATGFKWRFGDGLISGFASPKHFYNIGGVTKTFNITLVAVVKDGCSDSIVKAVTVNTNPLSDFTYTADKNIVDFKATQSGNTNYKWIFGNGDSSSNKDIKYTYPKSGTYTACLQTTNAAGCSSKSCKEVSVTVGISPIHKQQGFKIYPNPNTGKFTIEIENPTKDVAIEVYDLVGNLIKTIETTPTKKSYSIEMNVADGIYVVRVSNGGQVWNQKVSVNN